MKPEDSQIVTQLLKGDESTFSRLFEQHYQSMYGIAFAIAGPMVADEVVQEAWISAIKGLSRFEGRASLKIWLMRIVANEAKTRLRKESRSISLDSLQDDWATDPRFDLRAHWAAPLNKSHHETPESLLSSSQLKSCIEKHLSRLPDNQKAAIHLRDVSGFSMEEICNILQVSHSNLRVLLHRGRDKILQVITHFEKTGEC